MRPRTKSIVNSSEYFREESAYATCNADTDDDDNWMAIAMRGSSSSSSAKTIAQLHHRNRLHHSHHHHNGQPQPQHGYSAVGLPLVTKGRKRGGSNESNFSSRSTLPSWDENDPDFDMDDDEQDDDDEDDDGIARRRRCSHDRRISFDDDVAIVTIPSRDSFDADYKRRVWYSMEDLSRMRELV